MKRAPLFGSFASVAIVLVMAAGVIQQSRFLSKLNNNTYQSNRLMQQQHTDGYNTVNVGNLTLKNASTITPEYPPIQQPKSKVRRERRQTTNRQENIKPQKAASVRRPPITNSTRRVMYIHVGKTGGYTLDTVFLSNCAWYGLNEARSECYQNFNPQNSTSDSVLSYLTKATVHLKPRHHYDRWINETTTFLYSIRNPIARAVSAFDMDHNLNNNLTDKPNLRRSRAPFYECFPTAEHLAQGLFGNGTNSTMLNGRKQEKCRALGWNILTGNKDDERSTVVTHLYHNYQFYMNFTLGRFPDREIMVVRTENVWEDIAKLDKFLGGTGQFQKAGHKFDHGRAEYLIKSELSTEGKQYFCRALQDDIVVYRMLVERAVNLNATEKNETLNVLRQDCGDAWID